MNQTGVFDWAEINYAIIESMEWYIVYIFRNKINKKCYVGQTNNILERVYNHFYNKRGAKIFHRAIKKHGPENIELVRTIVVSRSEVDRLEEEMIVEYKSLVPNGYNILPNCEVHRWWEIATEKEKNEVRKKLSEIQIGRILSENTKQKMSLSQKERWENTDKTIFQETMLQINRDKVSQDAKDRAEKILGLLEQGKNGVEIAKIVGTTPEYVYKVKSGQRGSSFTNEIKPIIKTQTGSKRNSPEAKERLEQIKKLYASGLGQADIARQVGCSKNYISNLKKKGVI